MENANKMEKLLFELDEIATQLDIAGEKAMTACRDLNDELSDNVQEPLQASVRNCYIRSEIVFDYLYNLQASVRQLRHRLERAQEGEAQE